MAIVAAVVDIANIIEQFYVPACKVGANVDF